MSFRSQIAECKLVIDIPHGYGPTEKYQGTLGHKVNHKFVPPTKYRSIETARYLFFEIQRVKESSYLT